MKRPRVSGISGLGYAPSMLGLSSNDLALVAIIVPAAAAVAIAIVNAVWQSSLSRRSQQYEQEMAIQERRSGAYVNFLTLVTSEILATARRFAGIPGPSFPRSDPASTLHVVSRVQAFGSREVAELLQEWIVLSGTANQAIEKLEEARVAAPSHPSTAQLQGQAQGLVNDLDEIMKRIQAAVAADLSGHRKR